MGYVKDDCTIVVQIHHVCCKSQGILFQENESGSLQTISQSVLAFVERKLLERFLDLFLSQSFRAFKILRHFPLFLRKQQSPLTCRNHRAVFV